MAPHVLTDVERTLKSRLIREDFHFWLDFTTTLGLGGVYRRWFASVEARNAYIISLEHSIEVTEIGDER